MEEDIDKINGALPINFPQEEVRDLAHEVNQARTNNDIGVFKKIKTNQDIHNLIANIAQNNALGDFASDSDRNIQLRIDIANQFPNYRLLN